MIRRTILIAGIAIRAVMFCQFNASSAQTGPATQPIAAPIRMVLVGDSTVCDYPASSPNRGWGQFIQERFNNVTVINLAASGRSTKTFISEGRWKKALDQKPDYVLIQFGHNDSHAATNPEATNAATDYQDNLRKYIDDSRAIGAVPILVTPMVRRVFDDQGKITDASLQPYADAMRAVAAEKKVPLVDLRASSKQLMEKIGPRAALDLANKMGDSTHFNEKGARAMADLVMKELPVVEPPLAHYLKGT
jgi:lysophospholipase L1-like esterase